MREYEELDGGDMRVEGGWSERVVGGGRVGVARRRAPGPRPVRPEVVAVAVRPVSPPRPVCGGAARAEVYRRDRPGWYEGERVLERPRPQEGPVGARERLRRVLAGAAVVGVSAAVVVGLGLLSDVAAAARAGSAAPVVVTVEDAGTVWDVAREVAPAASGPEVAELVERIVTVNELRTVAVAPGQVLRVPVG